MDLNFTVEEEAFRQEAREWISVNLPEVFKTSKTRATRKEREEILAVLATTVVIVIWMRRSRQRFP